MANDGRIIIDTKLDTKGFEKDVETASKKAADDLGKGTEKAMKQAEDSINKIGKAAKSIDFSNIGKQMDNISKSIEKTSTQIDKQKQKLDKLKKAYENATNVDDKNKIASQMQKAEASITKYENKLNSLNNKKIKLDGARDAINGLDGEFSSASVSVVKSLDKIDKKAQETGKNLKKNLENINIGEDISRTGKSIEGVGDKLTTGVTLPILGLGAAAAKIGMDFDSGMSRVKAISGATGQEFVKLHDQALQLGADTAFSAKQAAEGMENLASAGFSTNEIMQAMPGLLDLAASSGESLASSSDIAASTLRGFGLAADQTGHVADVLAKNAGATNAAVADTGEAMKYIAPVAHAMGLSLEEVTASIGEMANSGIKGSQAGTTLRSALTRLASPSKEAAGMMKQLGFNAFDSQGKLKPLSTILGELQKSTAKLTDQKKEDAIATIFGQEAMSGMMVLMQGGSQALEDLTNSYKNSDGAAKDMAKTMQDNAKSAIEQMTGSLETAAIKLEEVAAPTITKLANEVMDMANRFSELPPSMQESIIQTALFAAAIGPVTKIVGSVTGGIGSLITFGGRLATTLGLLGEGASIGGTALTAFSTAGMAAAGVAGALVVGIAGAVTYNELLEKSVVTSTDDLNAWERAVNACTGSTIKSKSELQKAGLIYKDFGEGVSDSFKEGIEKATKQYHDFEMTLTGENSGEKISEEGKKKISRAIDSMIDGAKATINKRKSEIQSELSKMFNQKDGIDSGEQAVLDEAGKASDEKLKQIEEIQGKISDVWTKAIQEHGKLSQEDVETIEKYLQQVKQIQAEVEAKNTAESDFAKNQYGERLNGISADDAKDEYKSASEELTKKFADARATYKTGIDELTNMELEAARAGETARAETYRKQVEAKKKEYSDLIKVEKDKRREYLDMLYKKNPTLEGTLNEVDGSLFSKADYNTQEDLSKIKQQFSAVADATESGMKRVQDSTGKWHDIYVTVDQATGNITSAYDTFTGKFGGYSEKFANDAKATGAKVSKEMQQLASNIQYGASNLKLDGKNIIKIDTGETVSKMQTIIEKANGMKVAIANINGEQVKIEFNKDGTVANADDVRKAVIDHLASSPAKVDIDVNDREALDKFKETEDKADELGSKTPTVETTANTEQANSNIDTTSEKVDNLNGKEADVSVNAETSSAQSNLDSLWSIWSEIVNSDNVVTKTVKTILESSPVGGGLGLLDKIIPKHNYTGTGGGDEGLTTINERRGFPEITTGEQELYYLGGGTGILDSGSSKNYVDTAIANQVGNGFGKFVSILVNALGVQNNQLGQIIRNTLDTANSNKENVKLNQKLATDLVTQWNSKGGTFNGLQTELTTANANKEKASSMKTEDNYWVSYYKQWIDSIENDIDGIRDKVDETTDESYKKQLQAQQKALEKQKNSLQKEYESSKDAAEKEIKLAKDTADKEVKIAEEKKEKITKLAEAVSDAIKAELEEQKAAAEKSINDELSSMEKSYNSKIAKIEKSTQSKSDSIDRKIKELEEESTDNSRDKERTDAKNNINVLKTKMSNTASEADKRALALQIKDAQKELQEKEDAWNIEDQKAALEQEKALLQERADNRKKSLEEQYNKEKEAKQKELKEADEYYDKLLETDSVNARARYLLLNGNNQELVLLLNSYAPNWQNAGQTLADSLLAGLNSQKQSVQDAVNEMISIRESKSSDDESSNTYYDVASGTYKGFASGTSFNPVGGYYLTNEEGPEMSTSGDVAYVSKGAAIKNAMQTKEFISSEISRQVGLMKSAVFSTQAEMATEMISKVENITHHNNKITNKNDNSINFNVEHFHNDRSDSIENISDKLGFYAVRNRTE